MKQLGPAMAILLMVAGCDSGATQSNSEAEARTLGVADDVGSVDAETYVASIIRDDVDDCFNDVKLVAPRLDAKSGVLPTLTYTPARVVVLVDGSGSMAGRVSTRTKLELARAAARAFVDGLQQVVETSLLAFGQQGDNTVAGKPRSCAAVDALVPMTRNRKAVIEAVSQLRAVGWTPLAAGLAKAEASLAASAKPGEQIIYVVSDGEETCGGDPIATATRINQGGTRAIINIIGFGLPSSEAATFRAVASAGGGTFINVNSDAAAQRTFAAVRESNRASGNAVRASSAGARNAVGTSNAASRAAVCTSSIMSGEALRLSSDLSRRTVRGAPVLFAEKANAILKTRHEAIRARERAFRAQLSGSNDARQAEIDEAEAALR